MLGIRRRRAYAGIPWPLPRWNTLHLRLYGAAELGTLASRGDDGAIPRTKRAGGELFVGVDILGDRRTTITQAQDRAWYKERDVRFSALIRDAAWRAPYDSEERHGGHCEITHEEQAAAVFIHSDHSARVLARLDRDGDTVAIALTATCVIVTSSADEAGIRFIIDRAENLIDTGASFVSIHPLTWRNGQLLRFDWREDFPQFEARIDAVVRRVGVLQYAAQTPALERRGVDVAIPQVIERADGTVATRAIWRQRTRALLPVVDEVVVEDRAGSRTTMPMAEFLERAGSGVTQTELSPARYAVKKSASV